MLRMCFGLAVCFSVDKLELYESGMLADAACYVVFLAWTGCGLDWTG